MWRLSPGLEPGESLVVNVSALDVEPGYDFVYLRPAFNASAGPDAPVGGGFGAAWIRLTGRDRRETRLEPAGRCEARAPQLVEACVDQARAWRETAAA